MVSPDLFDAIDDKWYTFSLQASPESIWYKKAIISVKSLGIIYHPKIATAKALAEQLSQFLPSLEVTSWICSSWDEEKYKGWFNNLDSLQQKAFSHTLPDTKTQQYYEMIGKYDQFIVGWEGVDFYTPLEDIYDIYNDYREHYMDMRYDSNKLFKRATTGAYLAMFNHILSAIDAAWTAKRHNSRIVRTAIRMENKKYDMQDIPMLTLKINW